MRMTASWSGSNDPTVYKSVARRRQPRNLRGGCRHPLQSIRRETVLPYGQVLHDPTGGALSGLHETLAAKDATSTIPIVFVSGDPIGDGLVTVRTKKSGSHATLRWRKQDSNPRSHLKEQPTGLHVFDSVGLMSIAWVQLGDRGATRRTRWDREFESPLLQQRVHTNPIFPTDLDSPSASRNWSTPQVCRLPVQLVEKGCRYGVLPLCQAGGRLKARNRSHQYPYPLIAALQ